MLQTDLKAVLANAMLIDRCERRTSWGVPEHAILNMRGSVLLWYSKMVMLADDIGIVA